MLSFLLAFIDKHRNLVLGFVLVCSMLKDMGLEAALAPAAASPTPPLLVFPLSLAPLHPASPASLVSLLVAGLSLPLQQQLLSPLPGASVVRPHLPLHGLLPIG